jgi:hypothetical protein
MKEKKYMPSMYSKVARLKGFVKFFFEKYEPVCYFCKEKLDWKEFYRNLKGGGIDSLTEHHIDGQHYNNDPSNRELCHRKCHAKYHRNE